MPLLTKLRGFDLGVGDVLRLPENYDLRTGSEPVDLIVYDPRDDGFGLGLMAISGYKAGLTFCVFPRESIGTQKGLSASWLLENWDRWFRFTYEDRLIPYDTATVIGWDDRSLIDHEKPGDPNDMLDRALDTMLDPSPSTIRQLLAQPVGQFIEMSELVPNLDLGGVRILVSWQPYESDECSLMILYFNADTWESRVSMHSERWKSGRSEH